MTRPSRPTRATIARKLTAHDRISERDLQSAVIQAARLYGWLCYHTYDSRRCSPGFPDLVLCNIPSQQAGCVVAQELHKTSGLIFAELKSERGRLSSAQKQWITALRSAGADVRIWRPSDWDEIIATLGGKDYASVAAGATPPLPCPSVPFERAAVPFLWDSGTPATATTPARSQDALKHKRV